MPPFEILSLKRLSGNSAMGFAIKANAEMIERGQAAEEFVQVSWDDSAVVAYEFDRLEEGPVGIITYSHIEWRREVAIKLGYVDPAYRLLGMYKIMWNRLVADAKNLDAKLITGVTYTNNKEMREVAAKLGRSEHSINLHYNL